MMMATINSINQLNNHTSL